MPSSSPKPCLTIEERLSKASLDVNRIFKLLRCKIEQLPQIEEYLTKPYIGYRYTGTKKNCLFVEVHIRKNKVNLHLRSVKFKTKKLTVTEKPTTHEWTLNLLVDIYNESDIEEGLELIKQSYRDVIPLVI